MMFKAAIFDMDGLLLDSERICMACFLEAGQQLGHAVDPGVYLSCIGTNEAGTREILVKGHGADFPFEAITELWRKRYLEQIRETAIPKKDGAQALLEEIVASGTPIALATSTAHELAWIKLRNAGLAEYFDFVVGGDQVAQGKPHPEIYLRAASALDVSPLDCIAFEDSENGVLAALAANMSVVQVPDLVEPTLVLRSRGHRILPSLRDVSWQDLQASREASITSEVTEPGDQERS